MRSVRNGYSSLKERKKTQRINNTTILKVGGLEGHDPLSVEQSENTQKCRLEEIKKEGRASHASVFGPGSGCPCNIKHALRYRVRLRSETYHVI